MSIGYELLFAAFDFVERIGWPIAGEERHHRFAPVRRRTTTRTTARDLASSSRRAS